MRTNLAAVIVTKGTVTMDPVVVWLGPGAPNELPQAVGPVG